MSFSPDDSTILLLYFDLFVSKVPCVPLFRSFDVRMGSPTRIIFLGPNRYLPFYWNAGGFAYVDRSIFNAGQPEAAQLQSC